MVATAKCPHCKKRLRNETPGHAVVCPGCERPFRMPEILGEADDPLQPEEPSATSLIAEWDDAPPVPETEGDLLLHHLVECKELLERIDATESRVAVSAADAVGWIRHLSKQITLLNQLVLVIAIPFVISMGLFTIMLALGLLGAMIGSAK